MALKIFNTMKRRKEVFSPRQEGRVGMYACGVTVYDLSHIGHARAMVVFDVIQRYLKSRGYVVTYVRNYTDIDDKIIKRAQEESLPCSDISERYIKEFDADMEALGVEPPTHTPRATQHIDHMLSMVQTLVERGHAYVVDGDVYFDVSSFGQYGKLSGKNTESLMAGVRIEVDERKRSPLDFALWKKSKDGEPFWESPWGKGRPGWHIECSAMSREYLGDTFDLHCGGMDLVFPHHENEIAQAECATGKEFVRYWLHNGFVKIDQEKMSKSLKNFLTIRDVLEHYHPEAVRLFLLSHHYRSPVDFSDRNLQEVTAGLDRLYGLLCDLQDEAILCDGPPPEPDEALARAQHDLDLFERRFGEAMDDDFNTAAAIGHLYALTRTLNGLVDGCRKGMSRGVPHMLAAQAVAAYMDAGRVLGILNEEPRSYCESRKKGGLALQGISEEDVRQLIDERIAARKQKDWKRADEIRDRLASLGVTLKDTPQGTQWTTAGR